MNSEGAAFCAGVLLGIVFGALACGTAVKAAYQSEAIENGAACYDQKTGEWQWVKREELRK